MTTDTPARATIPGWTLEEFADWQDHPDWEDAFPGEIFLDKIDAQARVDELNAAEAEKASAKHAEAVARWEQRKADFEQAKDAGVGHLVYEPGDRPTIKQEGRWRVGTDIYRVNPEPTEVILPSTPEIAAAVREALKAPWYL